MKVKIEYTFIFEPAETWSTSQEFESWLSKSLGESGLMAERVRSNLSSDEGLTDTYIIHKAQELIEEVPQPRETMKQKMRKFTTIRDEKGRIKKPNT